MADNRLSVRVGDQVITLDRSIERAALPPRASSSARSAGVRARARASRAADSVSDHGIATLRATQSPEALKRNTPKSRCQAQRESLFLIFVDVNRRGMNRQAMLTRLSRPGRWKAALSLAWLYAFCILIPHAAFALSAAAHCLTETHAAAHAHQAAAETSKTHGFPDGVAHTHEQGSHLHADGSAPHKHADDDGKTFGTCCGLFCVSAIAHAANATLAAPVAAAGACPALENGLSGRGPDRIHRPPIA